MARLACLGLLLLLASAGVVRAAPLEGTVLDGQTLEPIPEARVTAKGTGESVSADAGGRFKFEDLPTGSVQLRIEAEGYEPSEELVELEPGGLQDLVFVLLPPGVSGEIIELTEEAPEEPEAPGQQEMRREEITRIPGARGDALQTLKSLPGVANADAVGAGPGLLVIRGAAPEDSKITIDGIEVPLVYHFFGLQSILPSEFIETIDYLPGGFGVEEGRATGGLINIRTRATEFAELTGFAEMSFINLAALIQGPVSKKRKLYFAAGVRRSAIDFILPHVIPDDVNLSFVTAPQYYDAQLRLDWQPEGNHKVWAMGLVSYDLLTLLNEIEIPNEPLLTGKWDNEIAFTRLLTGWKYARDGFESQLTASVGTGDFRVEVGAQRYAKLVGRQLIAREDLKWEILPEVRMRAGADLRLGEGDVDMLMPLPPPEGGAGVDYNFSLAPTIEMHATETDHAASAYLATDIRPTGKTTITPGLRLDYYHRYDESTLSPRVAVRQEVAEDWTVHAALGTYTRPLDQGESIATYLEPELATQYVLGGEHRIAEGFMASASGFYTDRRQLVVQDPALAATDPENAFVNRGFGRSYGFEGLVRARTDRFFGWISYTLSRSDRVDSPLVDSRLFDYDQTHNFITVASYKYGNWSFGGRWQLNTGSPITPILGSVFQADFGVYLPIAGEVNSDRLDTNHQLDVRIDRAWRFRTWSLSAYLDVTNVYAHPRTLGFRYDFDYSEREAIKELPIVPALGIRGSF